MDTTEASNAIPSPSHKPRSFLLFASTAALTLAADFLIYGHRVGLGLALFFPLLWLALAYHRRPGATDRKNSILAALLAGAVLATAIAPSGANTLILLALTCYAAGHWIANKLSPYWARALQGLAALFWLPGALRNFGRGVDELCGAVGGDPMKRSAGWLARSAKIVIPAALVTLPFVFLLGGGNAVLGQGIQNMLTRFFDLFVNLRLPSELRILFWLAVATAVFTLLGNRDGDRFALRLGEPNTKPAPSDSLVAIWRTRLVLIAVNLLFFAANTADLVYLWGGSIELPVGVSFSEFVHEGVHSLIASVVLAALVLLFLFNQSPTVTRARLQKALAGIWIGQNLLLVAGVILRLKLYVDAYGMSVQRVHVVMFLALVAVGFLLLGARILRERPLRWLVGSNLLAIFALFYVAQFLDVRGFVANYNVAAARDSESAAGLDIEYLKQLAPESWPALREVADSPGEFLDADRAAAFLAAEARRESATAGDEDWRSWRGRLAKLRRENLEGFVPTETLAGRANDELPKYPKLMRPRGLRE